jgi:hypothetical protein
MVQGNRAWAASYSFEAPLVRQETKTYLRHAFTTMYYVLPVHPPFLGGKGGGVEKRTHTNNLSENNSLAQSICTRFSRPNEVGGYMRRVSPLTRLTIVCGSRRAV